MRQSESSLWKMRPHFARQTIQSTFCRPHKAREYFEDASKKKKEEKETWVKIISCPSTSQNVGSKKYLVNFKFADQAKGVRGGEGRDKRRAGTVTPQKTPPNPNKKTPHHPLSPNNTPSLHNCLTEVLRVQQRGGLIPNGSDNQNIPFPLITT